MAAFCEEITIVAAIPDCFSDHLLAIAITLSRVDDIDSGIERFLHERVHRALTAFLR